MSIILDGSGCLIALWMIDNMWLANHGYNNWGNGVYYILCSIKHKLKIQVAKGHWLQMYLW